MMKDDVMMNKKRQRLNQLLKMRPTIVELIEPGKM